MSADVIVPLITMAGWLALVIAGYRTRNVSRAKTLRSGAIWLAVFGGVAVAFRLLGF